MAEVAASTPQQIEPGVIMYSWSGLGNGDTGAPVQIPHYSDKTVQVTGTFGAGGNVKIEGSNEGTLSNFAALDNPNGTALDALTDTSVEGILENPRFIRPNVSNGDGTTDLTVRIVATTRPTRSTT